MKELLFDMHVHTSGISRCSRVSPLELVKRCQYKGADGFVLTNQSSLHQTTKEKTK